MNVADEHRYPCAQCGADLRFAPGQTDLVCDHCGHRQTIAAAGSRRRARAFTEHSVARGLQDDLPADATEEVRSVRCPSCGGVVEFQGAAHATECPFCATPVVVDTGTTRHIKPQGVVPFQIAEPDALKALTAWMGSLWFAPNTLLEYARKNRAMTGVYAPYWTFDADTATRYRGQRGDNETRTRTVTRNGKQETESYTVTNWRPAAGRVDRTFDDVMIMASATLPERLGDELTPWDLSVMEPYSPDFLAGFQAEGYTVVLADGHARARSKMEAVIERDIRRDIGGDAQKIDSRDTDWRDETFKHVLLPIWMAAYKYNGKSYRFMVNGQTGEVQGERPYSIWKIAFAVILALVILLGAVYVADPQALGLDQPEWLEDFR
jgi:DNA-directed RNA polymerase subunit RPC12/RpoP